MLISIHSEDMKSLALIYSSSCPNYKPTRQILEEIGLVFVEINQDYLHKGRFSKKFSSPTLLLDNDIIIFGGKTDSSEGACSVNLPGKKELRDLLNRLI
jgi:hypothetical protein